MLMVNDGLGGFLVVFWCFFGDALLEIVMKLAANYPLILESLSLL